MHGKQTMFHTARSSPETFFAVCSRLIPKEVALTVEQHYSAIDADDLAILKAIKAAISDAGDREPAEIFELTLNALKAYLAKPVIEGETT
jgi:hypothetical protein